MNQGESRDKISNTFRKCGKEENYYMRYSSVNKEKKNGVVYTPSYMANYVATEMLKYHKNNLTEEVKILDPAVGEGELLISMIQKLWNEGLKNIYAVGYETDEDVALLTEEKLKKIFPNIKIEIRNEDFLDAVEKNNTEKYDFVIANPPYVRTQIMGSDRAQRISEKLSLKGRIDIYYAFLIYTKKVLKKNGVSGYITSNKFLTIKSGASVRNFILENYCIHQITDLGDTKLFNASVLPCIMIFSLGKTENRECVKYTSVYEVQQSKHAIPIQNIFEAIYNQGIYLIPDGRKYEYKQGMLQSVEKNALWNLYSEETQEWIKKVESKTLLHFSDIGKIRVGIKTTADSVFISNRWEGEEKNIEWIRPLITHRNAGQIIPNENPLWQVIYTHTVVDGKRCALDIEKAPYTKKYLLKHYDQLSGRNYIAKANRNWYEIWVPQNPDSWSHRKIVFRDISEKPQFWLDESGAVVNGDCYWIDIFPEIFEDTVYIALAIANSEFIEKYYDIKFNTKLYSGKRRFMTQYVEQFPIPSTTSETAQEIIAIVKKIIAENKQEIIFDYKKELNILVERLFS